MATHVPGANGRGTDMQHQSIVFSKLPPEIRLEIYLLLSRTLLHVEKEWDSTARRPRLRRTTHGMNANSLADPGLPLLLTCRRFYFEAAPYMFPQALVFTDLDSLSTYLSWASLDQARLRVRDIHCTWRAANAVSQEASLPLWKERVWKQCCQKIAVLPSLQRFGLCTFAAETHLETTGMEEKKKLWGIGQYARFDGVEVEVECIDVPDNVESYKFMTGNSIAACMSAVQRGDISSASLPPFRDVTD